MPHRRLKEFEYQINFALLVFFWHFKISPKIRCSIITIISIISIIFGNFDFLKWFTLSRVKLSLESIERIAERKWTLSHEENRYKWLDL